MLDADERLRILDDLNDTAQVYPGEVCVQRHFEERVIEDGDATALVFQGQSLSYAELNLRANRLAHHLRAQGVGPEVLVGIACDRSLDMVVGLLAILKAGGAYVPLDPEYPLDRLSYMIEDSGISLLLTQEHLLAQLPTPDNVRTLCLHAEADWLSDLPGTDLPQSGRGRKPRLCDLHLRFHRQTQGRGQPPCGAAQPPGVDAGSVRLAACGPRAAKDAVQFRRVGVGVFLAADEGRHPGHRRAGRASRSATPGRADRRAGDHHAALRAVDALGVHRCR